MGPGSVHHVLIRDMPHLHLDQPTLSGSLDGGSASLPMASSSEGDALPDLSSSSDPVVSYCVGVLVPTFCGSFSHLEPALGEVSTLPVM